MICESCGERMNGYTNECDLCRQDYLAQFQRTETELDMLADLADEQAQRRLEV